MKKTVIAVVCAVVIYSGAAYLTGYLGEKNLRAQLQTDNAQGVASSINIEAASFNRGIFSSDVQIIVKSKQSFPNREQSQLLLNSNIKHGPILFKNGLAAGLFSAVTSVNLKSGNSELDKEISDIFGSSIGTIFTRAYFDSSYTSRWILPALNINKDKVQFSLAESFIKLEGDFKQRKATGEIVLGDFEWVTADKNEIKISPISVKFDLKNIESGINVSNVDVLANELSIKNSTGIATELKKLAITQKQSLVNNNIDTSVKFSLEKISGPVEVSNLYYNIDVNQINLAAIKAVSNMFADAPVADPTALNAFYGEKMKAVMPLFLQEGLRMKLSLGAEYLGLKPHADWDIAYKAPANGKAILDITDPVEYLSLVDTHLHLVVPESLAKNLPVAPYLGSYILQKENNYVLHAALKNGELVVGKTNVPQEALLSMVMAAMPKLHEDNTPDAQDDELPDNNADSVTGSKDTKKAPIKNKS